MASISGANTIMLKVASTHIDEGVGSGTLYPGMNVQMTADTELLGRHTYQAGGSDYVGTGTGITSVAGVMRILIEDGFDGGTVDSAYTSGENVRFFHPRQGDVFQALVVSGQNIIKGDALAANTAGKFAEDATNPTVEALENSNGALSADTLMRVRCL